ncbi:MAG: Ribonuclease P protein component 3 [Candidatus Bathyarchaeota archaeon BA2]|nr:MAG: Ribonuclease P protein component 3 [Candidatus Bathyarchaeota archaeon BA2]
MRRFVDLRLRPSINDPDQVERMIRKSSELGYRLVGIPLPPNATRDKVDQLQRICSDTKIDFVARVDFAPKTPGELLQDLRRFRRRFGVVSVTCISKRVTRQAAKDRRVDLLLFPATDIRKRFFDHAEAELASKAFSCLEIEMAPLLSLSGSSRIHLLSRLRREVAIAKKSNVPVVISSGATNQYLMRNPHDYAALVTLFNMPLPYALRALSEDPLAIVERNREKLSPDYVAPGIRVVRRKNCV